MSVRRCGAAKAGRESSTTALLTSKRANARRLRAARGFLENAGRVAAAGVPALSEDEIQAEIEAVRRVRKGPRHRDR